MIFLRRFFGNQRHTSNHWADGSARRAATAALGVLLLALLFLAYADSWYANQLRLRQQAETAAEVRARGQALAAVLNSRLSRLQGLAGFIIAAEDEEAMAETFDTYAAGLYASSRGIRYMALAPAGIVQHLYAPEGNIALLGQDLMQTADPEVRAAVVRAIATEEPVLAGPLTFADGRVGLIGTRAVYRDGAYWGLVQIGLDLLPLFNDAGISPGTLPLELALRDEQAQVFLGNYTLFARDPALTEIPVAGERWALAGIPAGGWEAAIGDQRRLARIAGMLVVGLLTAVVYLTIDHQGRLQRAVNERTQELAEAQQLLEERVEERTHELQTLLDVSRNVASTLDFSSLLTLLLDQLQQVVDFDDLALYLVHEENRLELDYYYGSPAREAGQRWQQQQLLAADLLDLRTPLIIPDVSAPTPEVDRWRRMMGELPGEVAPCCASWMAVPLLLQNRPLGMLVFEHATVNYYTPRHAQLALAMANHVAVAIENARLYEQAHSLAALKERQKLARELHDSVSQALYGIGLGTRTALTLLEKDGSEGQVTQLRQPLEYTLSLAKAALVEMRALIFELRPESLEVEGLIALLTRSSDALHARHQLEVQTSFCPEPELPLRAKEALYRVAQEALHNVVRHAEASRATISLTAFEGDIVLEVTDDGIGFDPQAHFPGHLGLQSMRERVEGIGGQLKVTSSPGVGTSIWARIPMPPR